MPEIRLVIPDKVHAELTRLASNRSLEEWARSLLIQAAEEARPSLRNSGLWHMHVAEWHTTTEGDQ